MYRVIGGDKSEYGPATADEIRQWIAEGRLSRESFARGEDETSWKQLSAYAEFAEALKAQVRQPSLSEAPPVPRFASGRRQLEVIPCLMKGWALFTSNFGLILAATTTVWMIGTFSQFTAVGVIYWILRGVLFGGLYWVVLKRLRGQEASLRDVFSGFGPGFQHLMLAGIVTALLSWLALFACVIPGIYLFIGWLFSVPLVADKHLTFWTAMETSRRRVREVWFQVITLAALAFLPVLLVNTYLETRIMAELYPVLQDVMVPGKVDWQKFIEASQQAATKTLSTMVLAKVILLFNLPFGICVLACAYEELFGKGSSPQS